ncbi:MAG: translation initiation factor IF-2 N-terminal domain-containing protein [Syntrophomonas sp.]|nr:translation initiation factor IF-2 N-terminal domain-containing protein [Syntrophomonas sp.]
MIFVIRHYYIKIWNQHLNQAILEAQTVRQDLGIMMEESLNISQMITAEIDNKIAALSNLNTSITKFPEDVEEEISYPEQGLVKKIRIYELAKEIGVSSSWLVKIVQESGLKTVNHLNCLDENQVFMIKQRIQSPEAAQESIMPHRLKKNDDEDSQKDKPESINTRSDISIADLKKAHPYLAVRTLTERGYSIRDIAKLLERGQGEVILIMNLAQKKKACS